MITEPPPDRDDILPRSFVKNRPRSATPADVMTHRYRVKAPDGFSLTITGRAARRRLSQLFSLLCLTRPKQAFIISYHRRRDDGLPLDIAGRDKS